MPENLVSEPFIQTVGRRLYTRLDDKSIGMLVHQLADGKLLRVDTLEAFEPDPAIWLHSESRMEPETFVLMVKWSDSTWGDECIALFGSHEDASGFTATMNLGRYTLQKVKLVR